MKKIISLLLSVVIILSMLLSSAYAYDVSSNYDTNLIEFKNFIEPVYVSTENYAVFDRSENIITDKFIEDTYTYVQSNDWESVYSYYFDNVYKVEYYHDAVTRSNDIAKTVTFAETYIFYYDKVKVDVNCNTSVTLYYDPNTAVISTISNPQLSVYTPFGFLKENAQAWGNINANGYSATIYWKCDIYVLDSFTPTEKIYIGHIYDSDIANV